MKDISETGTLQDLAPEARETGPEAAEVRRLFVPELGGEYDVYGEPEKLAALNHQQGEAVPNFLGTCGLVSCEDILRQFNIGVTERDVILHAVDKGECALSENPGASGGTTLMDQANILTDYGLPAHYEVGGTLESLAAHIEQNRGVIIEVNAGILWNDPRAYDTGLSNHAIVATGVVRDPTTHEIRGYYINDSGANQAMRFVDAWTMQAMYVWTGGQTVITDAPRPRA